MKHSEYFLQTRKWFEEKEEWLREHGIVGCIRTSDHDGVVNSAALELKHESGEVTFIIWDDGNAETHQILWNIQQDVTWTRYHVADADEVTLLLQKSANWLAA
jgi:hypothetical protein